MSTASADGWNNARAPLLPPRPLDAERPDTRREPPPDGEHDRGGNQRAVGVAHRQPNAADLGVEAAGPRHDRRRRRRASGRASRDRSLHAVATAGRPVSIVASGMCRSARVAQCRAPLILQAISHRLHFEAAARCIHPGALALVVAWTGAGMFAASLAWFVYCYVVRFGQPAPAGSIVVPVAGEHAALLRVRAAPQRARAERRQARDAPASSRPSSSARSTRGWRACSFWPCARGGSRCRACSTSSTAPWRLRRRGPPKLPASLLTVRASAALDVLDLAGVRAVERRAARTGRHRGPAAHHARALRVRAPPAVLRLGALRLRRADDDRHPRVRSRSSARRT